VLISKYGGTEVKIDDQKFFKPMVPSYGLFETKQLLFEKFFSPGLDFRDIRLDGLKWSTLYILFKFLRHIYS